MYVCVCVCVCVCVYVCVLSSLCSSYTCIIYYVIPLNRNSKMHVRRIKRYVRFDGPPFFPWDSAFLSL